MIQIHPRRPFVYIEKQSYVTIKPKCKLCHIQLSLEKAAEVSFIHWSVKPRGLARGYKRLA